jgi:hypothetical protein
MSYSPEEIDKFRGSRMWTHECHVEKTTMQVGDKEPCNWCGLYEEQYMQLKKKKLTNEEFLQEIKEYNLPHFREG